MQARRVLQYIKKFSRTTRGLPLARRLDLFRNAAQCRFGAKTVVNNNGPIYAMIEPTSNCNLECVMCIRNKVPLGTLSFDDFERILEKLPYLLRIHIQGQGEPFINKDIYKMIHYARGKGIMVTTTTNATMINDTVAQKILDAGLSEIVISFDSTQKEKAEKIRKGIDFDKVSANIQRLDALRKRLGKPLKMSITATIMGENLDEIGDFVALAARLGVDEVIFQRIFTNKSYLKHYEEDITKHQLISKRELEREIDKHAAKAKRLGINIFFDEDKCVWPWSQVYITSQGDVTPCCMNLDPNFPKMGNLLKDDFTEIWNCQPYQEIRSGLLQRQAPQYCEGCKRLW